jgi:RNA polymerase-binding transcription factor DksA
MDQQMNISENEMQHWRELLDQRRQALLNQEKSNDEQAYEFSPEGLGILSKTSQHPADEGSETNEIELRSTVNQLETKQIQNIEDAEERLYNGTFGVCENCKTVIPKDRLEAMPEARYCLNCEKQMEKNSLL